MGTRWVGRRLLAASAFALLVVACGGAGQATPTRSTIGVSFYTNTIPLYVQMRQGMEQEAAAKGVGISFAYANNDAAVQQSQIADFVTKKASLILCSPVSTSALVPAYNSARQAGVPIISVANKVPDANEDAFIGRDWSFVGNLQVEAAAKALGGTGKIAIVEGPPTIDFVRDEVRGWHQTLAKYPSMQLVTEQTDPDLSQNGALNVANTVLNAHPDVKAILATDDDVAMGVVQALQEHNIAPGAVFVAGLDGEPRAVDSIKHHQGLSFTISVKGVTWGKQAVDVAVDWLHGKKPSQHTVLSAYQVVDASNVNQLGPSQLN
jgi:ribose transport system substrate-binding protein